MKYETELDLTMNRNDLTSTGLHLIVSLLFLLPLTTLAAQPQQNAERGLTIAQQKQLTEAGKLNDRAAELYGQGKFREAIDPATRSLYLREQVFGADDPEIAASLNNLAIFYARSGDPAAGEPLLVRALAIREKALGPTHPDTARSLNSLAGLYRDLGKFSDAEPLLKRAIEVQENISGATDPALSNSLNTLAVLYETQSNFAAAEPLYVRALKIRETTLGPDHPGTATSLNNLAGLYDAQGNYGAAEPLYRRALAINEKSRGLEHPDTARSLNNLAYLYMNLGNAAAAEPLFERSLKIYERTLGSEHVLLADALDNLGKLNLSQGDYTTAEAMLRRAMGIREKQLGNDHHETANSYGNMALLLERTKDYDGAEEFGRRAVEVYEKSLGPAHPFTATSLGNLAGLYDLQGRSSDAESMYLRVLKINEESLGADHPATAISLNNLAVSYKTHGKFAAAEPLYQRALAIQERALGPDHPSTALSLENLALINESMGQTAAAGQFMERSRLATRKHTSRTLTNLSEHEQSLFLATTYEVGFHAALSLGLAHISDQQSVSDSATWLINGKGVAQEALACRALQTRDIQDPSLGAVVRELMNVRTRLASLAMNAAVPEQLELRRSEMERLTALEQKLASQLVGDADNATSEWIEISQIQKSLAVDSVLIDIARFNVFNFQAKGLEPKWKSTHYAAWITSASPDSESVLIDLGDAEDIDELVENVRSQIAADASTTGAISEDGEDAAVAALMQNMSALADLIWKPLTPHLGGAKQIILSPDGALWLAPWSALPANDAKDQYLLERYSIRMVISGRELIARPDDRSTTAPVILANPEFDQQESQKKLAIQGIFNSLPAENENVTRSFSAKSSLPRVQPLPNTGIEALAVQPHIETYASKKVGLYKEQYALERVAKALRSPQIVAFATHGFFLPAQENEFDKRIFATDNDTPAIALDTNGEPIENPLLRCGLLLAGCNNREASVGDDDGILTGMEIVGIDLRGTELVVLSACETGIGDVRNGEGVAGLRQAFQLAGAEAVVSTLWQVPDRDSALLMKSFFEELAGGATKAEALRTAQIQRIEKRRQRYGAAHPFYWAAFTVTGQ